MEFFSQAASDANSSGVEFMRTEIFLANTFLDVSRDSRVTVNQEQGRLDAAEAYRSVLHFLPKLRLTTEEILYFATGMDALRDRLIEAGVAV